MRILILCTGNSCRSQMAQAALSHFAPGHEVCSAGTQPAPFVHPMAVEVMAEVGLSLSGQTPKHVNCYIDQSWDWVITVCGGAKETCPIFTGTVKHRIHIGWDDPAKVQGSQTEVKLAFVRSRERILSSMQNFAQTYLGVDV